MPFIGGGVNKPWIRGRYTRGRGFDILWVGVQNTMGRWFNMPWVRGSKYHVYVDQNTMDMGRYTIGGGSIHQGYGVYIPWIEGQNPIGREVNIPWVGGSIYHG